MTIVYSYSKKILSKWQLITLLCIVGVSIIAFSYTYLAVNYLKYSLIVSIADSTPHLRVFPESTSQAKQILIYLQQNKNIVRADKGILVQKKFHIVSRKQATEIGKEGKIYFSGTKNIKLIGYAFDKQNYIPPILMENVYSKQNREEALHNPNNDPITILNDPIEIEHGENWCILSKNLTNIFDLGFSIGNPFEIYYNDLNGNEHRIFARSAGYLNDSPLEINSFTKDSVIYTRESLINKLSLPEEQVIIVDASLYNRNLANIVAELIKDKFNVPVENWKDVNQSALPFLNGITITSYLGIGAIVLLSIIGISIVISMIIIEKAKQLAVLFALGLSPIKIRLIFVLTGIRIALLSLLVGFVGALLGVYLSLPKWNSIIDNLCYNPDKTLNYSFHNILLFIISIIILCAFACWFPSGQIVYTDPIKNLRSE